MQTKTISNGCALPEAAGFFQESGQLHPEAFRLYLNYFPSKQANKIQVLPYKNAVWGNYWFIAYLFYKTQLCKVRSHVGLVHCLTLLA